MSEKLTGAVDFSECPYLPPNGRANSCRCERCAICGFRKHTAVHGPLIGQPPGSKPYGHQFVPIDAGRRALSQGGE